MTLELLQTQPATQKEHAHNIAQSHALSLQTVFAAPQQRWVTGQLLKHPPLKIDKAALEQDLVLPELSPNPLLKRVKDQAQWFHRYQEQGSQELPDAFDSHALFEPQDIYLDYECLPSQQGEQRLRLKVCVPEHLNLQQALLKVELQLPNEQMVLISEMSEGSWNAETLLIPANRSVCLSFRVFAPTSYLTGLSFKARFAEQLYLMTTMACFPTTIFQAAQSVAS